MTDSTCDLPDEVLERYDISIVPLTVRFGEESYRDRVDISTEEFFRRLGECKEIPSTSQVSVGEFTKVFEGLSRKSDTVLGLFLSARLSGTCQSAVIAKNVLGLNNIHIMDTTLTTLAQGMVVLEAAQMAAEGKTLQEITERVTYMADNMYSMITLGTLTYLEKGGRISAGTAFVGNLLNIMPIVTFINGEVKPLDKVRGRRKLVSWIANHIQGLGVDLSGRTVGINHIDGEEIVEELKGVLRDRFNVGGFVEGTVGSVIGTYSGPEMALGVYFIK
ncbi:MAG: DegV family protein [Clostridiales bacterium]|nr:DegV family protein [Clostridiales bacterium]